MILYNVYRFISRACAGGFISTLFTGKAEPFGVKFDESGATIIALTLVVIGIASFIAESMAKRKAGL